VAKILVSGASGFIGNALSQQLQDNYEIFKLHRDRGQQAIKSRCGNIIINLEDIDSIRKIGITHIVHCAGLAHKKMPNKKEAMDLIRKTNIDLTDKLAKLASELKFRRFIFLSSVGVHGDSSEGANRIDETSAINPSNIYSESKYEAEIVLQKRLSNSVCSYTIFRPPAVYGNGMKGNLILLKKIIASGLPVPICITPNKRSLISVYNLITAIEKSIHCQHTENKCYTVCDTETWSFEELVDTIGCAIGRKPTKIRVPRKVLETISDRVPILERRLGQVYKNLCISSNSFCTDTGWSPKEDQRLELLSAFTTKIRE